MKIRSFSELQDFLDDESAWRKRELSFLRLELRDQREKKVEFVIRSAIALSYAHLEGFVKMASESLLTYLTFLCLKRADVDRKLVNSYLFSLAGKFGELKNPVLFTQFVDHALDVSCTSAMKWDSKKLVRTKSNLKYDEFKEILFNIGLDDVKYELKRAKVDALVEFRNSIAHGEKPAIDVAEAVEFVDIVQDVIEGVKVDIINFIAQGGYKSVPAALFVAASIPAAVSTVAPVPAVVPTDVP